MRNTAHEIVLGSVHQLSSPPDNTFQLVVTSPPYPMIAMWDEQLREADPEIAAALDREDGKVAFELMHRYLDKIWQVLSEGLSEGGFICINIGDATRSIGGEFQLYSNHSRITSAFIDLGLSPLPVIIWRKQTNAPNKFMGSGMLPAGAYVTLEHEYILVFRKGGKKSVPPAERKKRQESAYFWEERNQWFSDLWDFKGSRQKLPDPKSRSRSGAFPFELAYRLICMYSLQQDTVVDPFGGTGTTALAAASAGRDSRLYEIDPHIIDIYNRQMETSLPFLQSYTKNRIEKHILWAEERQTEKAMQHYNTNHQCPVMTSQEKNIYIPYISELKQTAPRQWKAEYNKLQKETLF